MGTEVEDNDDEDWIRVAGIPDVTDVRNDDDDGVPGGGMLDVINGADDDGGGSVDERRLAGAAFGIDANAVAYAAEEDEDDAGAPDAGGPPGAAA